MNVLKNSENWKLSHVSIANEILMSIRSSKKYANDIYLQDTIGVDGEGNEVKVEDKIADFNPSIEDQVELKMKIQLLYDKIKYTLKGRERTVLELRYGLMGREELTQREIADKLDISRSYVSRIEKKALKKLFKEIMV
ncbi:MAG: sigma-70 family RNA polymerase sigma factor [Clostridiales bacterium]|jgi:RNA polymerase sporulation-specific sigma factor|nr:sigma-70 family RNA polymerase sigma factor [Clostridiales bacterium]